MYRFPSCRHITDYILQLLASNVYICIVQLTMKNNFASLLIQNINYHASSVLADITQFSIQPDNQLNDDIHKTLFLYTEYNVFAIQFISVLLKRSQRFLLK